MIPASDLRLWRAIVERNGRLPASVCARLLDAVDQDRARIERIRAAAAALREGMARRGWTGRAITALLDAVQREVVP